MLKRIRRELPGYKIIGHGTGYTWEEMLLETDDKLEMLDLLDILVDGRFELSKNKLNAPIPWVIKSADYRCTKISKTRTSCHLGTNSMMVKKLLNKFIKKN